MYVETQLPNHASALEPSVALRKLQWLAHLMRALSASYAGWVLWQTLNWWTRRDDIVLHMGNYLQRDLSAMAAWQPMVALGLDLFDWALLLIAVAYCWKFLACLQRGTHLNVLAPKYLACCAWFAVASQAVALLFRPLKTYVLTSHLSGAEPVFKWAIYNHDMLGAIVGLTLLMFAYLFTWVLEVVEENRSFV